jgi:hypothetical protein
MGTSYLRYGVPVWRLRVQRLETFGAGLGCVAPEQNGCAVDDLKASAAIFFGAVMIANRAERGIGVSATVLMVSAGFPACGQFKGRRGDEKAQV